MAGNFFRGTTVDQVLITIVYSIVFAQGVIVFWQDPRWGRSDKKLMASLEKSGQFAAILNTKVQM